MENKSNTGFVIVIIVFLVALIGLTVYIVYDKVLDNKSDNVTVKTSESEDNLNIEYFNNLEFDDSVRMVLYLFADSNQTSLIDYLKALDNNDKLLLGNIHDNITLKEIKEYFISVFGTDLNIEGKDYYNEEIETSIPEFYYNADTDMFTHNDEYPGYDGSALSCLGIYNYRLKDVKKDKDTYTVYYYGLYEDNLCDLGPTWLKNFKSINRVNSSTPWEIIEEEKEPIDSYLNDVFKNNKDEFFVYKYTFNKDSSNYYLVDFEIERGNK